MCVCCCCVVVFVLVVLCWLFYVVCSCCFGLTRTGPIEQTHPTRPWHRGKGVLEPSGSVKILKFPFNGAWSSFLKRIRSGLLGTVTCLSLVGSGPRGGLLPPPMGSRGPSRAPIADLVILDVVTLKTD